MLVIPVTGVLLQSIFEFSSARPNFVTRIPNGNAIMGVRALGHVNKDGDGPLNVFGLAFQDQGSQWTLQLCESDSDGDGASNGEELGDPCCTWPGTGGLSQAKISHPGISDMFTSEQLGALRCQQKLPKDEELTTIIPTKIVDSTINTTTIPTSLSPVATSVPTSEGCGYRPCPSQSTSVATPAYALRYFVVTNLFALWVLLHVM